MSPSTDQTTPPQPLVAARTDVGAVRELNEDSYLVLAEPILLAAVADGMGGHAAGEVASAAAVRPLRDGLARFAEAAALEDGEVDLAPHAVQAAVLGREPAAVHLGHRVRAQEREPGVRRVLVLELHVERLRRRRCAAHLAAGT